MTEPLTDDWRARHFDLLSPAFAREIHETLEAMRRDHPVTWSDQHGGYWVVTRYEDVLRVAQDWRTFSSEHGVSVPYRKPEIPAIPEHVDPPLHRLYRQVINSYFSPKAVTRYEPATRDLVVRMIEAFAGDGRCEFMEAFARPFPGLSFFDQLLGAPPDAAAELSELTLSATDPTNPERAAAWAGLNGWIEGFLADRRAATPRGDVVDAILAAEIDDRPITDLEVHGMVQLLILGGLDTTAGALGQIMIRFAKEPELPELLRRDPSAIPAAVEELLRLEGPFVAIARTAMADTEIGGQPITAGDKVLIYWASANRDEAEFPCPHAFDHERERNRHLAFGAGPHRCAGSHLARMNLTIALEELVARLRDIRLDDDEPIPFHSVLNRMPLRVPIRFTAT